MAPLLEFWSIGTVALDLSGEGMFVDVVPSRGITHLRVQKDRRNPERRIGFLAERRRREEDDDDGRWFRAATRVPSGETTPVA
jgi:hypothetical protein